LPSGLRRELTGETIGELVGDLALAADAGKLEDPEVVLTRTPLELDEKGYKKLNKLMAKTLDQALAIASESSARRNDGGTGGLSDRARTAALQARRELTDKRLQPRAPSKRRSARA